MTQFHWLVDSLVSWTATYLVHSTFLLMGCWLFFKIVRHQSHALADQLWKAACIVPLLTSSVQVSLIPEDRNLISPAVISLPPPHAIHSGDWRESNLPTTTSSPWYVSVFLSPIPQPGSPTASISSSDSTAENADTNEKSNPNLGHSGASFSTTWLIRLVVSVTVIAAVVTGVLRLTILFRLMRTRINQSSMVEDESLHEILNELKQHAGLRSRILLRVDPQLVAPIVVGVWKWTIIVPEDFVQSKTPREFSMPEIRSAFAHEIGHLVRRDTLWNWIGKGLTTCFAFQPLNRIAVKRIRISAEFLSDRWALHHGAERLELARCLTQLAEKQLNQSTPRVGLAVTGTRTQLSQRVRALVDEDCSVDRFATFHGILWTRSLVIVAGVLFSLFAPLVKSAADTDANGNQINTNPNTQKLPDAAIEQVDADLSHGEFKALVQLDGELKSLRSELDEMLLLADSNTSSQALHEQIVRINTAVSMLENARNGLARQIYQEN